MELRETVKDYFIKKVDDGFWIAKVRTNKEGKKIVEVTKKFTVDETCNIIRNSTKYRIEELEEITAVFDEVKSFLETENG